MMSEQEASAVTTPPAQPQQFELEQPGDYSQYLLYSRPEIMAVLRTLIQRQALITVYFDRGRSFLLTSLIDLNADNGSLVFDLSSNEEMNRRALLAKELIFTTVVDKVKVQFSQTSLSGTRHDGRDAFLGAMPDSILRLQRREYFRLATPIANPIKLATTIRRVDNSALQVSLSLLDTSGGGVGLMVSTDQAALLRNGEVLENCRITLPGEGLVATTLGVRNLFDVTTRSGARYVRVGCQYIDLPSARLTAIQRYITHVERERKARLSGLA